MLSARTILSTGFGTRRLKYGVVRLNIPGPLMACGLSEEEVGNLSQMTRLSSLTKPKGTSSMPHTSIRQNPIWDSALRTSATSSEAGRRPFSSFRVIYDRS